MTATIRQGTLGDVPATYDVFVQTTADLERRMGIPDSDNSWLDAAFVADYWERRRTLFEHLTSNAEHFWVAEIDSQIVAYARASLNDGMGELNEFFVLPDHQGQGIGRELLARAFPTDGARRRVIIATTEIHALSRYLKAGVYPRFPLYYLFRQPEPVTIETNLIVKPVSAGPETLAAIREIDRAVLGFARDADRDFLLGQADREVCLFYRGGDLAGYGFFGQRTGPIALLNEADFPAVLARAETAAAERGDTDFGMTVPLINRAAVDYLLGRGFQLEPFTVLFMSDEPFGRFENYIISNPDFFL